MHAPESARDVTQSERMTALMVSPEPSTYGSHKVLNPTVLDLSDVRLNRSSTIRQSTGPSLNRVIPRPLTYVMFQ